MRPLSATALCTACLIHQVAYVENRKPLSGSYFSTAFISPILPSWIRSSKGKPIPRYFLATETTSLKFFSMSLWRARLSPALALFERSISSWCVKSLRLEQGLPLPLVAILETLSGSAPSLPDPGIRRHSLQYDLES